MSMRTSSFKISSWVFSVSLCLLAGCEQEKYKLKKMPEDSARGFKITFYGHTFGDSPAQDSVVKMQKYATTMHSGEPGVLAYVDPQQAVVTLEYDFKGLETITVASVVSKNRENVKSVPERELRFLDFFDEVATTWMSKSHLLVFMDPTQQTSATYLFASSPTLGGKRIVVNMWLFPGASRMRVTVCKESKANELEEQFKERHQEQVLDGKSMLKAYSRDAVEQLLKVYR